MSHANVLGEHNFVKTAMQTSTEVLTRISCNRPSKIEIEFVRKPDEHEYYVVEVGRSLAHFLTCFQQLEHGIEFLTDYSYSEKLGEKGIRRHHHLLYNVENFIIRSQILYERVLQLIDRVLHLQNSAENCTHRVIAENVKVQMTPIPSHMGSLRRLLRKYKDPRDSIVHRESLIEEPLRRLEMLYIVEGDVPDDAGLQYTRSQLLRKTITEKRQEFSEFVAELRKHLVRLLDALAPLCEAERRRLDLVVGPIDR